MTLFPPTLIISQGFELSSSKFSMSPNVYLCIVSSIRIAYCFVRIAIRIVSVFFRIDPALPKIYIHAQIKLKQNNETFWCVINTQNSRANDFNCRDTSL